MLNELDARTRLKNKTAISWHEYIGNESILATMRLFNAAQFIVGYHGAGLLNCIFSRVEHPHVYEITTFMDLNSTKSWRSYVGATCRSWNPAVRVVIQKLPQVLHANGPSGNVNHMKLRRAPPSVVDHAIKNLRYVALTSSDLNAIAAAAMRSCQICRCDGIDKDAYGRKKCLP